MIALDSFMLEEIIGRGGMGVVWRARHIEQDVPVAVKVLTSNAARSGRYINAFQDEVRAAAGLEHSNIIMLFDSGMVTPLAEEISKGELQAGSPWLAMELCSQGSLEDLGRPMSWLELKAVLLHLLEALAHAHARGVIHRDIKPDNVMLNSDLPSRPGLKLTDFGIAHATRTEPRTGQYEDTMGTAQYMAPEQFEGRWRAYGPWTDLYALGCMAYELVCGVTPYTGHGFLATAFKHLSEPIPELRPIIPVPESFEGWVHRLMAKTPDERFQMAPDAAWALQRLEDPVEVQISLTPDTLSRMTHLTDMTAPRTERVDTDDFNTGMWSAGEPLAENDTIDAKHHKQGIQANDLKALHDLSDAVLYGGTSEAASAPPIELPPPPAHWQRPHEAPPPMKLVGAGLGLYGLRTIPMIGRQKERDEMWAALQNTFNMKRAQLVMLQGAAGYGSSRLATWLCERAMEVGAADIWRTAFGPRIDPSEGLARLVGGHLRCLGLERAETFKHLQTMLRAQGVKDDYEWSALTELIHPHAHGDTSPSPDAQERQVRFQTPRMRHVLVARQIERSAQTRPQIVWLEDVQWGSDGLAFVEALLERQSRHPCPILLMMTVEETALHQRPEETALIEALSERMECTSITVGPLPIGERARLVQQLLGLSGELAQRVEARTAGNPAFAIQLVGDWVQRGVLEVGPTGFRLRAGERAELPDDLHDVWYQRLTQLLMDQPEETRIALELAAALGQLVHDHEWREACTRRGISPPDLTQIMQPQRVVRFFEGGWSFTQSIARECLERSAREQARWAHHHQILAAMLAQRPDPQPGRLGRHLVEAGLPEHALEPLHQGINNLLDQSDYRAAADLLRLLSDALDAVDPDGTDPRWAWIWTERARVHVQRGKPADAIEWASRAREHATTYPGINTLPRALLYLAHATRAQGKPQEASALYHRTMGAFEQLNDLRGIADCLRALGQMRGSHQSLEQRVSHFEQALVLHKRLDDEVGTADSLRGLSQLVQTQGDLDRAWHLNSMAMDIFARCGNQLGQAHCLNAIAEISRYRNDLDTAESGYRRALDIYESVGAASITLPQLNLGLVLLARSQYREARHLFERVLAVLEAAGRRVFLGAVHANLLPTVADARDWAAWDHHIQQAMTLLDSTNLQDPDIAWPAQLAGDIALDLGELERASQAYAMALSQWTALKREDRAETVKKILRTLGR